MMAKLSSAFAIGLLALSGCKCSPSSPALLTLELPDGRTVISPDELAWIRHDDRDHLELKSLAPEVPCIQLVKGKEGVHSFPDPTNQDGFRLFRNKKGDVHLTRYRGEDAPEPGSKQGQAENQGERKKHRGAWETVLTGVHTLIYCEEGA